jgi:hypothetical protein
VQEVPTAIEPVQPSDPEGTEKAELLEEIDWMVSAALPQFSIVIV